MMSKVISMAVALVIGGAAINAGPAVAGPIGNSTSLDVASPNLVLEVKQRATRQSGTRQRKRLLRQVEREIEKGRELRRLEQVRTLDLGLLEEARTPELRRF